MGLQELFSFWSKFQKIIDKVSQEFDNSWQSRKRSLDSKFLILFIFKLILSKNKQGYGSILSEIWELTDTTLITLPQDKPFAASSVCEARQKLPEEIFIHLNKELLYQLNNHRKNTSWNGHRVFAIDGSKVTLPPELVNYGYKKVNRSHYATGLMSCLYNLGDRMIYNFILESHFDERTCAIRHLDVLSEGDILVLDRGYFSYLLLHACHEKGVNIICRLQDGSMNNAVKRFFEGSETDAIIEYYPSYGNRRDLMRRGYQLDFKKIKLRLIKYTIKNETYIIATTLIGGNYLSADFSKLYHGRWGIEELYKISKKIIEIEDFHSKTDRGIKQELYAHVLLINISRIFESTSLDNSKLLPNENNAELVNGYWQGFYAGLEKIKLNFKNCILVISRSIDKLIYFDSNLIASWISKMITSISRIRYKIRPGRTYPRRSRRPISKWGYGLKKKELVCAT
jgi:hypothetical protein